MLSSKMQIIGCIMCVLYYVLLLSTFNMASSHTPILNEYDDIVLQEVGVKQLLGIYWLIFLQYGFQIVYST